MTLSTAAGSPYQVETAESRLLRNRRTARDSRRYLYDPVGWIDRYIDWPVGMSLADYQSETLGNIPAKKRQGSPSVSAAWV